MIAAVECPSCYDGNTATVEFMTVNGIVESVCYTCVRCDETWLEPAGTWKVEE